MSCTNKAYLLAMFMMLAMFSAICSAAPRVSGSQPKTVNLQPGQSVTLTLTGSQLDQATGSVVYPLRSKSSVPGVTAKLQKGNDRMRKLKLSAETKSKPGTYRVLLTARGSQVAVPIKFTIAPLTRSTKSASAKISTSAKQKATKLQATELQVSRKLGVKAGNESRVSALPVEAAKQPFIDFSKPGTPLSTQEALISQGIDTGGGPTPSQPLVSIYNFRINDGSSSTTNRNVVLYHSTTNNPTHYRVAESSNWAQVSWIPYVPNPTYTLSASEGGKTVYLQVKGQDVQSRLGNPQPNVVTVSKSIDYYTEPLQVSNFRIDNGAASVSKRQVVLTWEVSGVAAGYRVSESANMSGTSWVSGGSPPAGGLVFDLAVGAAGSRTIYLQAMREGSNPVSLSDSINISVGVCPIGHRGLECSGAGTCAVSGQCVCNPDISGPACETICQRCYGAAGNNCGVADGMNFPANLGVCANTPLGPTCNINAGSWAHDECCVRYRTGGPNTQQGSCTAPGLGAPPYYCQNLLAKAVAHLSAPALTWRRHDVSFNKSSCTSEIEMPITHADMCNPSGGTLLCTDTQYCCSRSGKPLLVQPPSGAAFGLVCGCD